MKQKEQYIYKNGQYIKISSHGAEVHVVGSLPLSANENSIYLIEDPWDPSETDPTFYNLVWINWTDLKELRDNGKLIPGQQYRIMDYNCTTTQFDTKSAEHAFDIIVTADDSSTLNENARAARKANDTYFANSKLESWELKYCLDNDTTRFAWALSTSYKAIKTHDLDGESTYIHVRYQAADKTSGSYKFAWAYVQNTCNLDFDDQSIAWNNISTNDLQYTASENPEAGDQTDYNGDADTVLSIGTVPAGKGVIYYMKDEFNNECPYDFKNIQFKRYKVTPASGYETILVDLTNKYIGFIGDMQGLTIPSETDFIWCYTFHTDTEAEEKANTDASLNSFEYTDADGGGYSGGDGSIRDNIILGNIVDLSIEEETQKACYSLNNIVLISQCYMRGMDVVELKGTSNIQIDTKCYNLTMMRGSGSRFNQKCYNNIFGDSGANTFGNNCYNNTFGNGCYSNTFGNDCDYNTFGNGCYFNTFGNYCYYNTFGNYCGGNTFGNYCAGNTFGNYCAGNTFGDFCDSNTFGNYCGANTFGNNCGYNTFGDNCDYNTFGNNCDSNTFGNYCYYNTFGNYCGGNTLVSLGNIGYAQYNIFENGVQYVDLKASTSGSYDYLQNITIRQGIAGTYSTHKVITETRNLTHDVTYRAAGAETKILDE